MTGDIRSSWVDVITAAQTRSYNNMAVFWSYFPDFVGGGGGGGGGGGNRGFIRIQSFFAEVFQITSRFILARKKSWG